MSSYPIIRSGAGSIDSSGRMPATLPTRALCVGQFTVGETKTGLPQLVDPQGRPCGVFADKQLAEDTAASLSQ